jgi:hypothetical protein
MGFLGFLIGALFVIVLRDLQSIDPTWDPQIGLIVAGFVSSGFFLWGIGAFSAEMQVHAHEPARDEFGLLVVDEHDDHHEESAEDGEPIRILGLSIWTVAFLLIVIFVAMFAFANIPGGFTLQISGDANAQADKIGDTVKIPFGPEYEVSQMTAFIIFAIIALGSLAMAGGAIALGMTALMRGVKTAQAVEAKPLPLSIAEAYRPVREAKPSPARWPWFVQWVLWFFVWPWQWIFRVVRTEISLHTPQDLAMRLVGLVVLFVALYFAFYHVLIGLVLGDPESLQVALSVANAGLIALLVFFPTMVVFMLSTVGDLGGRLLRGVPGFLGNR